MLMEKVLNRLKRSKFRSIFHLNKKMKDYVFDKGLDVIKKHAYDFVNQRLKIYDANKDGKQTPMKQVHQYLFLSTQQLHVVGVV